MLALLKLKLLDTDKCNLVRWHQVFTDRGHICLAFEHLDKSLSDFMKERYFRPLPLKEIRPIVQQVCSTSSFLSASINSLKINTDGILLIIKLMTLITFQLATALNHLKAVEIIHADLKLENVMLVDHVREPYRVKVIDR